MTKFENLIETRPAHISGALVDYLYDCLCDWWNNLSDEVKSAIRVFNFDTTLITGQLFFAEYGAPGADDYRTFAYAYQAVEDLLRDYFRKWGMENYSLAENYAEFSRDAEYGWVLAANNLRNELETRGEVIKPHLPTLAILSTDTAARAQGEILEANETYGKMKKYTHERIANIRKGMLNRAIERMRRTKEKEG